jgi:hypothetical protein
MIIHEMSFGKLTLQELNWCLGYTYYCNRDTCVNWCNGCTGCGYCTAVEEHAQCEFKERPASESYIPGIGAKSLAPDSRIMGLTEEQANIVMALDGVMLPEELAGKLGKSESDVNRIIDELVEKKKLRRGL